MTKGYVQSDVQGRAIAILLAVVVLSGCGSAARGDGSSTERCDRSSDCADPLAVCVKAEGESQGQCLTECGDDRDCEEGQACVDGACTTESMTCRGDADCNYGQQCRQGLCEDIPGYCQRNSECSATEVCDGLTRRCIPATDLQTPCTGDGDCFAGEVCSAGFCRERPSEQCARNSDCALDEVCERGACVSAPQPECVRNSDCRTGEVCEQGSCAPDAGPECVRNSDCGSSELCVSGRCEPECVTDRDCEAGERCAAGACILDVECTRNSDCRTGEVCEANRCQPECVSDRDCAADEICADGQCKPDPGMADNPYSGQFQLSSTTSIQRCNDFISIQYDARTVSAVQNGQAYQLIFPSSVYYGSIQSGLFTVSWSGFQQTTSVCGDWNSANTFNGTFQGTNLWTGTLRTEHFFQVSSCNCVLNFQITGTRL